MSSHRIRCNGIRYRQGFIEVVPGIHPGHINIETWNAHPDMDMAGKELEAAFLDELNIVGNTEIELSVNEARQLVSYLQQAIQTLEQPGGNIENLH